MNADGSTQIRLTNNSNIDEYPSWARPVLISSVTLTFPNGSEALLPEEGYFSICSRVSNMKSDLIVVGGSAQSAYRMISVPLILPESYIGNQLDNTLPEGNPGTDWRLFRWSSSEERYKEYPDTGEGFGPGKAFWIIIREGTFNLRSLEDITVSTDEPMEMILLPGWNDIANPWLFSISSDGINNLTGANISAPYIYEDYWSDPGSIQIIEPWKGYAVRNNENINVIISLIPEPATGSSKIATEDENILWKLSIKASASAVKDIANHLGVRNGAKEEWDKYDHVEPPPVGDYVSVYFPHRDWQYYPYNYSVDFRPPDDTISWDFDIVTNIPRETVSVALDGIDMIPDDMTVSLLNRETGVEISLADNTFNFVSGKDITESYFTLVMSNSSEKLREQDDSKPEVFVTAVSYPNPFNPQTTIQYELSHAGKVSISVFNSLGQKVRIYELGHREQGIHELVFDASELTSGLYFNYIDAGYTSITGKMLYMK
ncbi:T9SS type A sorting domain-containing protein [Candidatus Latescibacterota bacterium]